MLMRLRPTKDKDHHSPSWVLTVACFRTFFFLGPVGHATNSTLSATPIQLGQQSLCFGWWISSTSTTSVNELTVTERILSLVLVMVILLGQLKLPHFRSKSRDIAIYGGACDWFFILISVFFSIHWIRPVLFELDIRTSCWQKITKHKPGHHDDRLVRWVG